MSLGVQLANLAAEVKALEAERDSLKRENRRLRLQLKNPKTSAPSPAPASVLGVHPDADAAEVLMAFRNLSKRHHPDLPGGDREKFEQLVQARDQLLDRRS